MFNSSAINIQFSGELEFPITGYVIVSVLGTVCCWSYEASSIAWFKYIGQYSAVVIDL